MRSFEQQELTSIIKVHVGEKDKRNASIII